MPDRYFVEAPIVGQQATLTGHEAHHLLHVMRARVGAEVILFDGSGAEFAAQVSRVGRSDVELEVGPRQAIDREAARAITLGVALPKGDRPRWLVEKATELGTRRIVPLISERSNKRETPSALDKLRRAVIEASKQCGRNRLMEVAEPQAVAEFFAEVNAPLRLIADPSGGTLEVPSSLMSEVALAIGPEGGFTMGEVEQATAHGWSVVGLGARILRVETAALALLSRLLIDAG